MVDNISEIAEIVGENSAVGMVDSMSAEIVGLSVVGNPPTATPTAAPTTSSLHGHEAKRYLNLYYSGFGLYMFATLVTARQDFCRVH